MDLRVLLAGPDKYSQCQSTGKCVLSRVLQHVRTVSWVPGEWREWPRCFAGDKENSRKRDEINYL